ncbi:MAG TPA: hypothetical protein VMM36_11755 [Opitutaceae bacterium]|nr:hypothetical protein [Opitutaceae bacterium]
MDWIFDNIQFVIAFAAAFAWWLNKRRESAASEDDEAPPPLVMDDTTAEDEARARRIQEEIRRKIAERRTLPPVAPPPVIIPDWARSEPAAVEPPRQVEMRYDPDAFVLEQQRNLEEKLRLIEATRRNAEALRAQVPVLKVIRSVSAVGRRAPPSALMAGLRNTSEVRRAIVLREVLGPPKGLQG